MYLQANGIIDKIIESFLNHGVDWVITAVVTFFSVRMATKKYYDSIKTTNVRPHMRRGLEFLSPSKDDIPANFHSIFVENKGLAVWHWKEYKCPRPFSPLRKTILKEGGNNNPTSKARWRDWGVLGLAYLLKGTVIFDFERGVLYVYKNNLTKYEAVEDKGKFVFRQSIEGKDFNHELSYKNTDRRVMIAVPLVRADQKIVGGVTFDVDCEKENGELGFVVDGKGDYEIIDICREINNVGKDIANVYFSKKTRY